MFHTSFINPGPESEFMRQKRQAESSSKSFLSIWFLCASLCVAFVCMCVCEATSGISRCTQICASSCLSFPLLLSPPYTECVSVCASVCVLTGLAWDAKLITADGCYEISLHSSFALVCTILFCTPPAPFLLFLLPSRRASSSHGAAPVLC